jgi:mRNA-degrading endonuclease RelE of RelBE toxin-antitoxin system
MNFRIADSFSSSLERLTAQEQKAVKTTAFDLQMNPANPGLQIHRVDKSPDKNFWSGRVNRDVRIILHRTKDSLLLCYAGHHDDAYGWAEKRKIERHPKTGAAQIVVLREKVVEVPTYRPAPTGAETAVGGADGEDAKTAPASRKAEPAAKAAPPLQEVSDERLLAYGVPADWLKDLRSSDEDELLDIAALLPGPGARRGRGAPGPARGHCGRRRCLPVPRR